MTDETGAAPRIDEDLVRRLIAAQFPRWAGLPVTRVVPGGNDNRTFRLGDGMGVRLPSAPGYGPQIAKERRCLPLLAAAGLPVPVTEQLAAGAPGEGYPLPWSVNRWLEGVPASDAVIGDLPSFARELGGFLAALHRADPAGGPPAGEHSWYRGCPPSAYDAETRALIGALAGRIDGAAATAVWEEALAARWRGAPAWFHGDVAAGNLLVRDGRLGAVIDFGVCGVGDPACDLAVAWTLFDGAARTAFRAALAPDDAMWARGRGWALWKALTQYDEQDAAKALAARRVVNVILAGG